MSAALSHVAVGLLLGLALGIRLRWLWIAGLLALLPDIDHLSIYTAIPFWLLRPRYTLHNALFCVLLPVVAYLVIARTKWGGPDARRIAIAAPLLVSSHLLLDMLPLDVAGARVPLLYPFSDQLFTMTAHAGLAVDPTAYSTITLLLISLTALAVGTIAYARRLDPRPSRVWPFAFGAAWLLVFPVAAAAGLVIVAPVYVEANLALEEPTLLAPPGRVTTVVYHLGGADAARGALRVEVIANGTRVASVTNSVMLSKGGRWVVDLAVPNVRDAKSVTVRLSSTQSAFVYSTAALAFRLGHYDTALATAAFTHDARGAATIRIVNAGDVALPAGAVRLVATGPNGASTVVANVTNDAPIASQATWTARFAVAPGPVPGEFELRVVSVDDGFVYVRESRTPDVSLT